MTKTLTADSMVAHGIHKVNDPRVMLHMVAKQERLAREATEKVRSDNEKILKKIEKMREVRALKGTDFTKYSNDDMKTYIQYKKRATDPGMPTLKGAPQKQALLKMAREYSGRESPLPSPMLLPKHLPTQLPPPSEDQPPLSIVQQSSESSTVKESERMEEK